MLIWISWPRFTRVLAGIILSLVVIAGGITFYVADNIFTRDEPLVDKQEVAAEVRTATIAAPGIGVRCPLDGIPLAALPAGRPLILAIQPGNPVGLAGADLVLELAPGNTTGKYLAVYYHGTVPELGPLAAAGYLDFQLAAQWDGILVHNGYIDNFPSGAQSSLHLDREALNRGFWLENKRAAPGVYTSINNLRDLARDFGLDNQVELAVQLTDDQVVVGEEKAVKVEVPGATVDVIYQYIDRQEIYQRQEWVKSPQFTQVIKNIIVLYWPEAATSGWRQDRPRLTGKALIISGGRAAEAQWLWEEKGRLQWLDQAGKPLVLRPGLTWIHLVPEHAQVNLNKGGN